MVISCFGSKKPPSVQVVLRYSRPNLLAVSLPSPAFITCAPNQNRHAMQATNILNYFTFTVGGCLSSVNLHWYAIDFFFQKTNHALIALWENRLIKYYLLFNRGYVVLISAQPWPEIEEFSLTFKVLDLKVLFAFHWFRISEKRNRVIYQIGE